MASEVTWTVYLILLALVSRRSIQLEIANTTYTHWELQTEVNIGSVLPVVKYRSNKTGLTVVLAKAESPIVNGYFCLATQAFDDNGLPHTLEHLIFLGSEDYPYKEVLDLLANRCLSDRTNAWTGRDHTCYTIYTAGSGGFLNILPVYMDHILFPLLREEDFLTEVHHISGSGVDAGVVYSEMQGVENEASNLLTATLLKHLYPGSNSYVFETGGKLKNLRDETNIHQVRKYHKQFYRPDNMYLIVTGQIDPEEVFEVLHPVETKIISKNLTSEPFQRPFQEDLDPLIENMTVKTSFPSKDAEFGYVSMGWRMPSNAWEMPELLQALRILTGYLTSSSISPLQRKLVEIDDPVATNIDVDFIMFSEPGFNINFDDVPVGKIVEVDRMFDEIIQSIVDKGPELFELKLINVIIDRTLQSHKMNLENSPHLVVPDPTVFEMLYGRNDADLNTFLNEESMTGLANKTAKFWVDLLKETFSSPRVVVQIFPSEELDQYIDNTEIQRVEKQIEDLGEDGLQAKEEILSNALQSQILPPENVLLSVPLADVDSISYRKFTSFNLSSVKQPTGFNLKSIPFNFIIDDMKSHFIRFNLFLDTSKLDCKDLAHLTLLTELWLQCPIRHPDTGILESLDDVVARRSTGILSITNTIGYDGALFKPGSYSHLVHFSGEAAIGKYFEAIGILKEALFNVEFTEDRIRTTIVQLLNSIPGEKLSAATIVQSLEDNMYFNNRTNIHFASLLRQEKLLSQTLETLKQNPDLVIKKLNQLRNAIVKPLNAVAFLCADLERLTSMYGKTVGNVWSDLFITSNRNSSRITRPKPLKILTDYHYRNIKPKLRHAIIGLPGSDACYLEQNVPFDVKNWESSELAAVRLMLQYMTDRLYDKIRGRGLTYGVSMTVSVSEGRINLSFIRASNINNAFKEFRSMVVSFTNVSAPSNLTKHIWDPVLLDSAKGSQIYTWAETEETTEGVSSLSVKSFLRGTKDALYGRRFVKLLAAVSLEDVKKAANKYLTKFLDPRSTQTAVVCKPSDVDKIKKIFSKYDLYLHTIEDLKDSVLSN